MHQAGLITTTIGGIVMAFAPLLPWSATYITIGTVRAHAATARQMPWQGWVCLVAGWVTLLVAAALFTDTYRNANLGWVCLAAGAVGSAAGLWAGIQPPAPSKIASTTATTSSLPAVWVCVVGGLCAVVGGALLMRYRGERS
jgi:uncharacterized membrane protein